MCWPEGLPLRAGAKLLISFQRSSLTLLECGRAAARSRCHTMDPGEGPARRADTPAKPGKSAGLPSRKRPRSHSPQDSPHQVVRLPDEDDTEEACSVRGPAHEYMLRLQPNDYRYYNVTRTAYTDTDIKFVIPAMKVDGELVPEAHEWVSRRSSRIARIAYEDKHWKGAKGTGAWKIVGGAGNKSQKSQKRSSRQSRASSMADEGSLEAQLPARATSSFDEEAEQPACAVSSPAEAAQPATRPDSGGAASDASIPVSGAEFLHADPYASNGRGLRRPRAQTPEAMVAWGAQAEWCSFHQCPVIPGFAVTRSAAQGP
ncbi:hypothetical protein WJX73_008448 [Symbiochloris irregularis]|uniref:Uncharacterized protein n=1 Tax=Symbiochloris irregularis TaxID=706552 RepID=A0AAW1P0U6_9CHLO